MAYRKDDVFEGAAGLVVKRVCLVVCKCGSVQIWAFVCTEFSVGYLQAQRCLIRGMATKRSGKTCRHSEIWADDSKGIVWN
jgi:hypothetical protein